MQINVCSKQNCTQHSMIAVNKIAQMVFCYQSWSDLLWEKNVHVINLFKQWKVRKMYGNRIFFLLVPGGFSKISNKLEQLEFKLEKKILGFRNMQEKLRKYSICICTCNISVVLSLLALNLFCFLHYNWCHIHVVTFSLISNLATDYIRKRRGEPDLFSFEYNLSPK